MSYSIGGVTLCVTPPIFRFLMIRSQTTRTLVARAPTRIDFGGGWTDVPPYSSEEGGRVCAVAISRYANVTLQLCDGSEPAMRVNTADTVLVRSALARSGVAGVDVTLTNDFPVSAGLGGSSAAGVALLGALDRWTNSSRELDRVQLAKASRALEVADLHVPGGWQDHFAAAIGGALDLTFAQETTARRLTLTPSMRDALASRCVVGYTGESRISGDTITGVMSAYKTGRGRVRELLARMAVLAGAMVAALESGDFDLLGRLVGEHWTCQRALHPAIPTPRIDLVLELAKQAGALGGKALGASGGGCVLVIAPADRAPAIRDAIAPHVQLLDIRVDEDGFSWTDHAHG